MNRRARNPSAAGIRHSRKPLVPMPQMCILVHRISSGFFWWVVDARGMRFRETAMQVEEKQSPATPGDELFYRENGYIAYPGFFSRDEVAALREAIDRAIETNRERIVGAPGGGRSSEAYEKVFNQMVNLWTDFPCVKTYSFSRRAGRNRAAPHGLPSRTYLSRPRHGQTRRGRQPRDQLAPGSALLAHGAGRRAVCLGSCG